MPFSMLQRIVPQALALTLFLASGALAAEIPFRSTVPLQKADKAGEEAALQDALEQLLVRVTGRRNAADLAGRFPPASSIVRQYRVIAGTQLEAEFDDALIRRVLEEAGEDIWEGERPNLTLWLVISDGERWLFQPAESAGALETRVDVRNLLRGALSRTLEDVSYRRGVEIEFPLLADRNSMEQCANELWTGFMTCLPRADDELLLLGRVAVPSALNDIEWSLRENGLWRKVWESGAAEAVHVGSDMLAARYMATQGPVRAYRLVVEEIQDLEGYMRLGARLSALPAVREWRVDAAADDSLRLRITSRTAEAPLRDALDSLGIIFELTGTGA